MMDLLGVTDTGVTVVRTETGNVLHKIEGSSDPAAWMLDSGPRTPKKVHRDGCYICEDDEFARMGLPLCTPCPGCEGGHVPADDTACDDCGFDVQDHYYRTTWLQSQAQLWDPNRSTRPTGWPGEGDDPVTYVGSGLTLDNTAWWTPAGNSTGKEVRR